MKKIALLILSIVVISTFAPVSVESKDISADTSENVETEKLRKYYEEKYKYVDDIKIGDPEDSTTKRANEIEWLVEPIKKKYKPTKERVESVSMFLLKHIKNDPYVGVRLNCMLCMTHGLFKPETVIKAAEIGLKDPFIPVRVVASTNIMLLCIADTSLYNSKIYVLSEKALQDVSAGRGRKDWNVKGLFTKEELKDDPNIVEKIRDQYQGQAFYSYTQYQPDYRHRGKAYKYIDSISAFDPEEEVRKSAKRARELAQRISNPVR